MSTSDRLRFGAAADRLLAIGEIVEQACASGDQLHGLAACLGDSHTVVQRKAAEAFATLAQRGVPVRDTLLTTLQACGLRSRWGAAFALSLLGPPPSEGLPVLLECLGVDDSDVRWAAAGIVVRLQDRSRAVAALCALVHSGNPLQRRMAAYCLRDLEVRSPHVEQVLLAALEDGDPGVRRGAVASLVRLSLSRTIVAQRLIGLLDDADVGVRRAVAAALGTLGERSAPVFNALRLAAGGSDASLRRAAERSLRLLQA